MNGEVEKKKNVFSLARYGRKKAEEEKRQDKKNKIKILLELVCLCMYFDHLSRVYTLFNKVLSVKA